MYRQINSQHHFGKSVRVKTQWFSIHLKLDYNKIVRTTWIVSNIIQSHVGPDRIFFRCNKNYSRTSLLIPSGPEKKGGVLISGREIWNN